MNTASNRTTAKTAQNPADEVSAARARTEARGKELKRSAEEVDRALEQEDVYADVPCTD
jgi:hypothetical protein